MFEHTTSHHNALSSPNLTQTERARLTPSARLLRLHRISTCIPTGTMSLNPPRRQCHSHRPSLLLHNILQLTCRLQPRSARCQPPIHSPLLLRCLLFLSAQRVHGPSVFLVSEVDLRALGCKTHNVYLSTIQSQTHFHCHAIHVILFNGKVAEPTFANTRDRWETADRNVLPCSKSAQSAQSLFVINVLHQRSRAHAHSALSITIARHAHVKPVFAQSAGWKPRF